MPPWLSKIFDGLEFLRDVIRTAEIQARIFVAHDIKLVHYIIRTISSIEDQQQKQSLHFSGGKVLGSHDGKLLIASGSAIYSILPVPVELQIQVRFGYASNFCTRARTHKCFGVRGGEYAKQVIAYGLRLKI